MDIFTKKDIIVTAALIISALLGSGGVVWVSIRVNIGKIFVCIENIKTGLEDIEKSMDTMLERSIEHEGRISAIEGIKNRKRR